MHLQPASRKEITRISIGTGICDIVMLAVLFLLSRFGIGTFDYRVLVGVTGGSAIAVLNFTILCLTVQNALTIAGQKQMKAFIQSSYNFRLLLQAAWIVIALAASHIHVIAAVLPLLFPAAVIYVLQRRDSKSVS